MNRTIGGVILLLLMVAACGGDDDSAEPEAPAGTVAATSPAATDDAATDAAEVEVVPLDVAPCDLVTADEVAAATGLAVEEVRNETSTDCVFDLGEEAGVDIFVTIEDGQSRYSGPAYLFGAYTDMVADGEAEVIADVGESAVCCPFRAIAVDAGGGRFIAVGVNGGYSELAEPRDALVALALNALARL